MKKTSKSTAKKTEAKQLWFRAKKYGWGWGLPLTWQGWAVFTLFITVWLLDVAWIVGANPVDEPSTSDYIVYASIIVVDVCVLLYFSFKHGEPPKWRWGTKNHGTTKS